MLDEDIAGTPASGAVQKPFTFSLELAIEDYRTRYKKSLQEMGWWVLLPNWMRGKEDKIKASWHGLAGHPLGNLRGFEFWDGPRYTYDPINGTWAEEEL